jgi:hypothetical protein
MARKHRGRQLGHQVTSRGAEDRRRVRAAFEQRFTAKRMAQDYIRHYQNLLNPQRPRHQKIPSHAH